MVGRLLNQREPQLLQEMLKQDLNHLRKKESVTARQARTYFFMKYGISNKTVLRKLEFDTMSEALESPAVRRAHKAPQPNKSVNQAKKGKNKQAAQGKGGKKDAPEQPNQGKGGKSCKNDHPLGQGKQGGGKRMEERSIEEEPPQTEAPLNHQGDKRMRDKSHEDQEPVRKKCTVQELAPNMASNQKMPMEMDSGVEDWELIEGVFKYREHIIAKKNGGSSNAQQVESIPTAEGEGPARQSTQSSGGPISQEAKAHEGESSQEPIGVIQMHADGNTPAVRELEIKAQRNNLTASEILILNKKRSEHGFSQSSEFTNPSARTIYRCPMCSSPINSNGLERALRGHMRKLHGYVRETIHIHVTKTDWSEMDVIIPGKPGLKRGRKRGGLLGGLGQGEGAIQRWMREQGQKRDQQCEETRVPATEEGRMKEGRPMNPPEEQEEEMVEPEDTNVDMQLEEIPNELPPQMPQPTQEDIRNFFCPRKVTKVRRPETGSKEPIWDMTLAEGEQAPADSGRAEDQEGVEGFLSAIKGNAPEEADGDDGDMEFEPDEDVRLSEDQEGWRQHE